MARFAVPSLALAASALAWACGGVDETVAEGHVSQFVTYRQYTVQPRLDVVIVVSTSTARDGAALRASVAAALRARMRQRAEAESWLRDVVNPVDVRALVANASDGSILTTSDLGALAWREGDATVEGADAFAARVARAIDAVPDGDASSVATLATLQRTLQAAASAEEAARLVVVVATSDDPDATSAAMPTTRRSGGGDSVVVVVPRSSAVECAPASGSGLASWARAEDAALQTPCAGVDLQTSFADYAADCLPRPLAAQAQGHSACRVRAFVPRGTACDAARGWRSLAVASARPLDPSLAGMDACEVIELGAEDGAACRDPAQAYAGGASGWCVPSPSRACAVSPTPRLVGASAPPFARIEVACELSP
jgi:hypothetical protein